MTDFASLLQPDRGQNARTIEIIHPDAFPEWLATQPASIRAVLIAHKVVGKAGNRAILPGDTPEAWSALLICDEAISSPWRIASQAEHLPEGTYRLKSGEVGAAGLGWMLAQHRFTRYRKEAPAEGPRILLSAEPARIEETVRLAEAVALVRDLVDTPAADMGPAELESEAEKLAKAYGSAISVTRGEALAKGYPMVQAVGQAAAKGREPRLIEFEWGKPSHPRIAIIGKGVCFDSGGLDLKSASGMRLMKKDMGGAAHALALAQLIMTEKLPVRLHLLVPAVENAVSGNAFRPGDIIKSRKGVFVEVDNTDAEGRLVLADALTKAGEDKPELIIDFATLTGAARIALGPDLPALFVNRDDYASEAEQSSRASHDPLWRMPLWDAYDEMLKSDIADVANASNSPMAGCITAALFLKRFIPDETSWIHLDTYAWRDQAKPGRPKGGDALGLRAMFGMLKALYPKG